MKLYCNLLVLCFLLLLSVTSSFTINCNSRLMRLNKVTSSPISFLKAKKSNAPVEDSQYWQGDWVCADCGYVYDRDIDGGGLYFEQQGKGFICPQCSAPRRRYAKKVGDQWGITQDGGDFPIYAFTFIGLAITVWFSLVYVPTL